MKYNRAIKFQIKNQEGALETTKCKFKLLGGEIYWEYKKQKREKKDKDF